MKVTIQVEFPDWFEIAAKQWLAANIKADHPPIAIEAPPPPVVFLQEALKEVFPAPAEPTEDEKLSAHGRMMFEKGATICDKCEKKKAPNHFELNSTICKTCEGKKLNPNGFPECRNCKKRKPGRWLTQIARNVWECKKPCTYEQIAKATERNSIEIQMKPWRSGCLISSIANCANQKSMRTMSPGTN